MNRWVNKEDLESTRSKNNCTDEEWKAISKFLLTGKCNSLEEKIICYSNMINNEAWYKESVIECIKHKESYYSIAIAIVKLIIYLFLSFIFLDNLLSFAFWGGISLNVLDGIASKIISSKMQKKVTKDVAQELNQLKMQLGEEIGNVHLKKDKFIEEIMINVNIIDKVRYPGFQNDLYALQDLAHTYQNIIQSKKSLNIDDQVALFRQLLDLDIEQKIIKYQKQSAMQQRVEQIVDKRIYSIGLDGAKYDGIETYDNSSEEHELALNYRKGGF